MRIGKIGISLLMVITMIIVASNLFAEDIKAEGKAEVKVTSADNSSATDVKAKKKSKGPGYLNGMIEEEFWWNTKVGLITGINLVTAQTESSSGFKVTPGIGLMGENNIINFGKFDLGAQLNFFYTVKGFDIDNATVRMDFISIPIIFKGRYIHNTGDGIDIGFGKLIPGAILGFENTINLSAEVAPENTTDTYVYDNTAGYTLGFLFGACVDYKWPLPGEFGFDIRFMMDITQSGKDGFTIPLNHVPLDGPNNYSEVTIGKTRQTGFQFYLSYKIGLDFFKP